MGKRGLLTLRVFIILFWASLFIASSLAEQGRGPDGPAFETVSALGRHFTAAFTGLKLALRGRMEPWNKIVLVEIDERPLVPGAPGRWPWKREMVAALITRAFEAGAKSVGADLGMPESDPAFSEIARTYGNRFVTAARNSLALELARGAKGAALKPIGENEINFRGPEGTFPHISSLELLIPGEKFSGRATPHFAGVKKADLLKDAYLLIAQVPKAAEVPGAEWSANVLDNLLTGDVLVPGSTGAGFWAVLLFLVLGAAAYAWATATFETGSTVFATVGTLTGLALLDYQFLFSLHKNWGTGFVYLELISLSAAAILYRWLSRRREQSLLRAALEKHVAPSVAKTIARAPGKLVLTGEKREATVLVAELDGFDSFAESADPKILTLFLREYLSAMTGAILRTKGTIGAVEGAKITAFWGAPLEQNDHASQGLLASLEILWLAKARRDHFSERYGVSLAVRLALASGPVIVGQLGPDAMFSYSAVGEAVSVASRIVGMTKDYGISALMTRSTLEKLQTSGEASPHHRVIDQVVVDAWRKPLELVQILEERLPAVAAGLFAEGRELCRDGRWEDAISRLERANQALGGEDGPSKVLLQRCRDLRNKIA